MCCMMTVRNSSGSERQRPHRQLFLPNTEQSFCVNSVRSKHSVHNVFPSSEVSSFKRDEQSGQHDECHMEGAPAFFSLLVMIILRRCQ